MISTYRPRSSFVMRSSCKLTLPLIINFYEWRLCIVQCKIYWILVSDLKLVLFTIGRKLLGDIMQNSLLVRKEREETLEAMRGSIHQRRPKPQLQADHLAK